MTGTVFLGPYSGGASTQRAPDFRTCTMPLITRRSSTRALPRVSVGRCGLIFENCAFVSQNWSRLIYASFSEAVNHATTFVPTLLWVRTLELCRRSALLLDVPSRVGLRELR